jgi:hypothetical protein
MTAKSAVSREQFVQAWIEALENGKYKQTRGGLRDDDGYCRLGVACDVHIKLYPNTSLKWKDKNGYFSAGKNIDDVLPVTVRKRLGLSADLQDELISMNDEEKAGFKKIAKKIKSELLQK